MKLDILVFRKSIEKIQVLVIIRQKKGTLQEDQEAFLIICCSFFFRMGNVPHKSFRENQSRCFDNPAGYETVWKKYRGTCEATADSMANAHSMLDT